jgi:hypothetical protein
VLVVLVISKGAQQQGSAAARDRAIMTACREIFLLVVVVSVHIMVERLSITSAESCVLGAKASFREMPRPWKCC